jgi:serine/threonine protein kinase
MENLERIHDCGYTYNDLKPQNILFDYKDKSMSSVNLVDFGLASKYVDSKGNILPKTKL